MTHVCQVDLENTTQHGDFKAVHKLEKCGISPKVEVIEVLFS